MTLKEAAERAVAAYEKPKLHKFDEAALVQAILNLKAAILQSTQ